MVYRAESTKPEMNDALDRVIDILDAPDPQEQNAP